MRAPAFWDADGPWPRLLSPLATVYGWAAAHRRAKAPWRAPVPVLAVGNLVAGGAGKTPVALALARRLGERGRHPHLISRGYGGRARGPLRVDEAHHGAGEVGDEPLLLAAGAPTWVARDRAAGARAAVAAGADVLVLDDGHQNTALVKDLALVVIDGATGFGNRRLLPAGPLREPIGSGLARADALVLLGEDERGVRAELPASLPVLAGRLAPAAGAEAVAGRAVVAFAGIARPEKFFATLEALSCELLGRHPFADHHRYRAHEVLVLADKAAKLDALLVTTAKDQVRLPEPLRALVSVVEVAVAWEDPAAVERLLTGLERDG